MRKMSQDTDRERCEERQRKTSREADRERCEERRRKTSRETDGERCEERRRKMKRDKGKKGQPSENKYLCVNVVAGEDSRAFL